MSYYNTCPHCGANLDPGEACNCIPSLYAALAPADRAKVDALVHALVTEQKTAPSAANTESGKADRASYQLNEVHPYFTGWGKGSQYE